MERQGADPDVLILQYSNTPFGEDSHSYLSAQIAVPEVLRAIGRGD